MTERRALLAGATALALAACTGVDSTGPDGDLEAPPTVVVDGDLQDAIDAAPDGAALLLSPARHRGPISITRPVSLIGGPGVVIEAPAADPAVSIVHTADVTLRDIRIEGGSDGVFIRSATGVGLFGIVVVGAAAHGIFAHDAEVEIADCVISDMQGSMPQGIEVTNSDGRPPSSITGCRIEGPVFEGVVSHVSRVVVTGNVVTGSFQRGIAISEMSAGEVFDNRVSGASGSAYSCGDRSWCLFTRNTAEDITPNSVGAMSTEGHGLVVQFHSEAYVEGLSVRDITGSIVLVMTGGALNPDAPLNRSN